ncbi:MAG: hypothetical protein NVS9B15_22200 [Acidobacteriaceae bacterium]
MILHLLALALIAYVVLGPKRFIEMMASAGKWKRQFDGLAGDVKRQLADEMSKIEQSDKIQAPASVSENHSRSHEAIRTEMMATSEQTVPAVHESEAVRAD